MMFHRRYCGKDTTFPLHGKAFRPNGRPCPVGKRRFDINIFNFRAQSAARTWLVVPSTCRAGFSYMPCRKNYKARRKHFLKSIFVEKRDRKHGNRADRAGLPCFLLQRYNIFRPKARSVKNRRGAEIAGRKDSAATPRSVSVRCTPRPAPCGPRWPDAAPGRGLRWDK